jgi:hypothetical protein
MKNKKSILGLLGLGLLMFTFTSCVKDDKTDSDTSIASDNYTAQRESDGIVDAVDAAALDIGAMRVDETYATLLPECATITFDTIVTPHFIEIAFDSTASGGNGCLCSDWDGKYRKGKIRVEWTGKYRDAGSVHTISTSNYYVNSNKFEYLKTVTNNGLNNSGHSTFSVNVSLGKITFTDGTFMTWTSNRTREWTQGEGTLTPLDDVYSITGSASGVSKSGTSYTFEITSPLNIALSCKWIRSGTIVISPDGKPTRTLDFGNGDCDSQATVTINGNVYNINL